MNIIGAALKVGKMFSYIRFLTNQQIISINLPSFSQARNAAFGTVLRHINIQKLCQTFAFPWDAVEFTTSNGDSCLVKLWIISFSRRKEKKFSLSTSRKT